MQILKAVLGLVCSGNACADLNQLRTSKPHPSIQNSVWFDQLFWALIEVGTPGPLLGLLSSVGDCIFGNWDLCFNAWHYGWIWVKLTRTQKDVTVNPSALYSTFLNHSFRLRSHSNASTITKMQYVKVINCPWWQIGNLDTSRELQKLPKMIT